MEHMVIIGAGQAGAQAIETLRRRGHRGPITLIGDESLLPYQRPPLSKKFLAGTLERDRLLFRHAEHYAEHGVDVRLGYSAVGIDRARQRVEIADGSHVDYEKLLLATGSLARLFPVPGSELAGVHYLRTCRRRTSPDGAGGGTPRRHRRRRLHRARGPPAPAATCRSASPCSMRRIA